jgi:DNA-binding SARP family transcriptional activator
MLWPNSDPESAANNLHKAIHMARHALEPELKSAAESHFILTRGQQITLQSPEQLRIDAEEFERLANAGLKSSQAHDSERALGMYRGDLLDEDRYEEWAASRRNKLRELYHSLLHHLAKIYESQSDYEQSINLLRKLVDSDPADEASHCLLMRLYAAGGNRKQALRQYQHCVEALRRELDTEPEAATVELHRQIESGRLPQRGSVSSDSARAIESIAILPFHNESGDLELEYLSDGVTESVINSLSQLPSLRVMAWGTVARFKGQESPPLEVGRTLAVRAVLTGRVIQFADRLIVRAELIDVIDGAQLWGNHYDRNPLDIFVVQEEIAREIFENLRLKLSGEDQARLGKRQTNNSAAYQFYLKGRYFWHQRTEQDLRKGIEYFNQAIAEDPGYAAAYDGLSD